VVGKVKAYQADNA